MTDNFDIAFNNVAFESVAIVTESFNDFDEDNNIKLKVEPGLYKIIIQT